MSIRPIPIPAGFVLLCALAVACDSGQQEQAATQSPEGAAIAPHLLVGIWQAESDRVIFLLDVRVDGTFTYATRTREFDDTGQIQQKAQGHWNIEQGKLSLRLERSLTGAALPFERCRVTLSLTPDANSLVPEECGPTFRRR